MSRLQTIYKETLVPQLAESLELKNVMEVPKITKVTLNMGVGEAVTDKKVMARATGDMELIAGQKPIVINARKSVATFKIRDGWPVGCKVTLRRERMYEFLDRLVNISIPRIRDFRGLNRKSFDGRGNYSFGITEQIMFPEIDFDKIDTIRGMDITITTSARTDAEGLALLQAFNFPVPSWSANMPKSVQHSERSLRTRKSGLKKSSRQCFHCRSYRAIPVRFASATVARSLVVHAVSIANLDCHATSCVKRPCVVMYRA